jgi:Fic family protein
LSYQQLRLLSCSLRWRAEQAEARAAAAKRSGTAADLEQEVEDLNILADWRALAAKFDDEAARLTAEARISQCDPTASAGLVRGVTVAQLHENGLSAGEIAGVTGLSRATVYRELQRAEVA